MYTKAKIAGHPLHPMLVAFPIAFYTAAFVGYVYYASGPRDVFWFELAYVANIAGVLTAVVASIPGFIDWAFGIPKGHPAKNTGAIHLGFNVAALIFFALSWWYNASEINVADPRAGVGVFLGAFGLSCTVAAGFLGWKLVASQHIGIEPTNEQERVDAAAETYVPGLRTKSRTEAEERRQIH